MKRIILALAVGLFSAVSTFAADLKDYDNDAFNAAMKAGKTILVHTHAEWCGTCKVQDKAARKILKDARFAKANAMQVNIEFDSDFLKAQDLAKLGVNARSKFIVYKGGKEVQRLSSVTREADIRKFFEKHL